MVQRVALFTCEPCAPPASSRPWCRSWIPECVRMYEYIRLLHRVAVRCGVMSQCVAVCCGVLQYAAVCCSMLQCVAACCTVLQRVAASRSVLQRVAACSTWTKSCPWNRSAEFGTKRTKRLSLNVCLQLLSLILLNACIYISSPSKCLSLNVCIWMSFAKYLYLNVVCL